MLVQPRFCDLTMLFCPRREKRDDVPLVVPFVERLQGIRKWSASRHPLGLFVGHILGDGPIDVDQIVLDSLGQLGGRGQSLFIERGL